MYKIGDRVKRTGGNTTPDCLLKRGEIYEVARDTIRGDIWLVVRHIGGDTIKGSWDIDSFTSMETKPDYETLYKELKKQHDEMYADFLERTT